MHAVFRPSSIVAEDGTIISLRYVESVSQLSKDEDAVMDKLKDDLTFTVTTVSGYKHTISIKRLVRAYRNEIQFSENMYETYLSVLSRWNNLLG